MSFALAARARYAFADGASEIIRRRLRDPAFWQIQAMVLGIAAAHYVGEGLFYGRAPVELKHLPVVLYIAPIIYAGLRFGREGGILTGVWAALLTLPNIGVWHRQGIEWFVESLHMTVSLSVGVVVAVLVEHEAAARRRAEALAVRVAGANRLILRAQEAERLRISRDLHDSTVQSLVHLCHQLDAVSRVGGDPAQLGRALLEARTVAEGALTDVRRFSRDLRPSILDDLGLAAALDWLVHDMAERSGVAVAIKLRGAPARLPAEQELALFRIVQEALRNAERHSGATRVSVLAEFGAGGAMRVRVEDDGRGFDPELSPADLVARGNLGLNGMYERADLIGARLTVHTTPGKGTVVEARLPG